MVEDGPAEVSSRDGHRLTEQGTLKILTSSKSLLKIPRYGRSEFKQVAPRPLQRQLSGLGLGLGQDQALAWLISARLAQRYANSNY